MIYIKNILSSDEIEKIKLEYGNYIKVTVDIDKGDLVAGCILHADGEEILIKNGSLQDNIWGGGINFNLKEVDVTAVLNLRPRLNNMGLEISDPIRKENFFKIVKNIFQKLWI